MTPVAEGDAFGHQVTADDATRRSRLFRKQGGASCTLRQTLGYVVSCGIAVTAVVAIVLVTIFHHDTGLETLSLCVSDECSVFAKHVSASLNRSVPPCNDFYEFVCGNWANANPGYVSEVARASAALVAKAAHRLTDRHATAANDSIVYKAAALFSVCIDGPDQLDEFRSSVLPKRMGVRWPEASDLIDPVQLMVNLSVKWQLPVLIEVRTDDFVQLTPERSPVLGIDTMSWWYPLVLKMRSVGAYKGYVRSFHHLFSDRPDDGESIKVAEKLESSEMFLIEKSGAHSDGIVDKFKLFQAQSNFTPNVSIERWMEALNQVWSFKVTNETYVYAIDPLTIKTVNDFLSNVTWEDANLLIGWHVIQKLAPAVSPRVRDLLAPVFGNETGQLWSVLASRCMDLVVSLLGMVPFAPIIHHEIRQHTREMADAVYSRVSRALQHSLLRTPWMDEESTKTALQRISKIKLLIGPPREADTEHVLSNLYKDVPAMSEDFLSSWIATVMAMQPRLVLPHGYADVYGYNPLWHEVRYNDDTSTLIIPVQDMFMPLFHSSAPGAINFAGMGALIARGLVQIFDPFQKAEWTRGWSEEAKRHYDKAYDCFRKAYGKSWQPRSYRRLFGDLAPIGSIYSAFRPSPTKDRQLADLREFNPQETFFIAFCHVQCVKNPLDEVAKARCNVPLRNLPEFAATFKCASGTPMNPPEKCRLW